MENLLTYILQVNLLLLIVFLGYQFLLKKLTFYILNRVYLIAGALYALVFPLVDIKSWFVNDTVATVPLLWDYVPLQVVEEFSSSYSIYDVLLFGIMLGATLFVGKLMLQLFSLLRIHHHSKDAKWQTYLFRDVLFPIVPFSFFNKIYLHSAQHKEIELNDIFEHETIHVKGQHTWDVLLFEILLIGCWYNPFVWLMRNAVRQNLEFLTDQQVLNKGVDRQTYQYSLLHVTQRGAAVGISNQFNFKTLKKRIMMMNKKRSSRLELSKYAFLLPIMLLAGASFTVSQAESKIDQVVDVAKDTPLDVLLPKDNKLNAVLQIVNSNNINVNTDSTGYLLNGKLVDISVIKKLDVKDFETVVFNTDNELTKRYRKKSILTIITKEYAGTLGTASQFSSLSFDAENEIQINGPLKGIGKISNSKPDIDFKKLNNKGEIDGNKSFIYEYDGKILSKIDFFAIPENDLTDITQINSKAILPPKYAVLVPNSIKYDGVIRAVSIEGAKDAQERLKNVFYVIDGVVKGKGYDISALNPNDIKNINVLKDKMAVAQYGESAADGVIVIETKNHTKASNKVILVGHKTGDAMMPTGGGEDLTYKGKDEAMAIQSISIQQKVDPTVFVKGKKQPVEVIRLGPSPNVARQPLFIVDDVEQGKDFDFKKIKVEDIESITVFKDTSSTALYGDQAKDGVIIVNTKEFVKKNK